MADREELEKQKLQAEIDLLRAQLDIEKGKKDKEEKSKESKITAAEKRLKNWLPLILTIIALGGGLWGGLFEPISNFIRERQRDYEVNWNEKMIGFVDNLSNDDQSKVNYAIIMLSAYELDALPILLLTLEQTKTTDNEADLIRRALKDIYDKPSLDKEKFNEEILKSASRFFDIGKGKKIDDMKNKVDGLINYIAILGEFGADNKTEISSFFVELDTAIVNWSIDKLNEKKIKRKIKNNRDKL